MGTKGSDVDGGKEVVVLFEQDVELVLGRQRRLRLVWLCFDLLLWRRRTGRTRCSEVVGFVHRFRLDLDDTFLAIHLLLDFSTRRLFLQGLLCSRRRFRLGMREVTAQVEDSRHFEFGFLAPAVHVWAELEVESVALNGKTLNQLPCVDSQSFPAHLGIQFMLWKARR
jgi:hypothetical protein